MGYFSELDLELSLQGQKQQSTRIQLLESYLHELKEQLDILEEIRPHDPMDPLFDRYFYADNTEDLNSAQ